MENIKDFLTSRIPVSSTVSMPTWLLVVLLIVLILIIIVIISVLKNSKTGKTKKISIAQDNSEIIPFLDVETPSEIQVGAENDDTALPKEDDIKIAEILKEECENLEDSKEKSLNIVKSLVDTESDKQQAEQAEVEKAVEEEVVAVEVQEEVTETTIVDTPQEEVVAQVTETVSESTESAIEICNSEIGGLRFVLRDNNGQVLYESRDFKTLRSCSDAVEKFQDAVKEGDFSIKADSFGNFMFILRSPTSNTLTYAGESFDNSIDCQNNIDSVKKFALSSPIKDISQDDIVANEEVYAIPSEIISSIESADLVGKWEISRNEDGDKPYFAFLLYSDNDKLLYESKDYASLASCKNGTETFIRTVREGDFRIDLDKSGRYKFVLRNKNNNSLTEYTGQNFATYAEASASADVLYKFALVTPTDTL